MDLTARRKIMAGARLRRLRQELGLSQSGMANEIGISISYLNLIERNQRPLTAQLLIKLSENYAVDPKSFATEEEQRSSGELEEIFADPIFQSAPVSKSEIRELAENAPAVVEAIKRLYRAYTDVYEFQSGTVGMGAEGERGEPATGPMQEDPVEKVRSFLQQASNHFPELEERAEEIAKELPQDTSNFFGIICNRLREKHNIRVQIVPVNVMPQMLRRFDLHRRKILISELMETSGRSFQAAFHLGLIEARDIIDNICGRLGKDNDQVNKLTRVTLANYFAAALMMPYQKFLEAAEALAYDVEVLSARFSASYEQVAHRLTTLAMPSARGVPFFMVRVDNAGNVSKRFSSGNFPFARFGGTCPRWNIHHSFRNPGQIETQIIELPDASRWFSIARTARRMAKPFGEPEGQFVVGLGCELKYASRLIYSRGMDLKTHAATPIGVNCRLCDRTNCAQRAAPPLLRALDINENLRGFSPFDSDLTR